VLVWVAEGKSNSEIGLIVEARPARWRSISSGSFRSSA